MSRAMDAPLEDDTQQANDDQQFYEEIDKLTELSIAAADIKKYVVILVILPLGLFLNVCIYPMSIIRC